MVRREIASERWPEVVDLFSRLHRNKSVEITLVDSRARACRLTKDKPLLGLIDERHGEADESITAMWGGLRDGSFSHSVLRPRRVSLSEWNDAFSGELEIESPEGQTLVIRAGPEEEMLPPGLILDGIQTEES